MKEVVQLEDFLLTREYQDVHEAYLATLKDVYYNPDCVSSPRGQKVKEKFNYQFTILNPLPESIITHDPERNKVIAEYSHKEFMLYESMSNLSSDFSKASKFWEKIANPDGTINSAYGYLVFKNKSHGSLFEKEHYEIEPPKDGKGGLYGTRAKMRTPWEWAKACLISDKDTRQSILRFSLPEHQWMNNKDQTCTLHGFFSIRNDKLDFTITMRSNDLTLGLVYDLPWFISLMYKMNAELRSVYPNLEIGKYTHIVHNIHIYERDEEKVLKMIGRL